MSLRYALLGLLNYSPLAGYDLKKVFDTSINFFWAAHTSQIYRELKELEEKGYVVSEMHPGEKGPDKRIYRITEAGLTRFRDWMADFPEPVTPDTRDEFLVRVFFSAEIGVDSLHFELQRKLKEYRKDRERLSSINEQMNQYVGYTGNKDNLHYWNICLRKGILGADANIAWAEESLAYLDSLKKENKE